MAELAAENVQTITVTIPRMFPSGNIVATDVSVEDYMRDYAESHHEWVEEVVIKMSPVSSTHDDLTGILRELFRAYFALKPIGRVKAAPFVMRLEKSRREPDLQVILNDNPNELTETYMDGPADICIEVISPSNAATNYGDKFLEYEQAGVREYWIIDPTRAVARFYRLNDKNVYEQVIVADDAYTTPLLPGFTLASSIFWQDELPTLLTIVQMVQDMLKGD